MSAASQDVCHNGCACLCVVVCHNVCVRALVVSSLQHQCEVAEARPSGKKPNTFKHPLRQGGGFSCHV